MENQLAPLILIGLMMFVGFAAGVLVERIGIPRVAIYVAVGALFSNSVLGNWFPLSVENWSPILTNVALAIIAYLVGAEIHLKEIHRQEKAVIAAALGQLLGVLILVTAGVWAYSQWSGKEIQLSAAFVLGSIASATAPAATIAVISEYRARGKLSDILLGVVAIDDALGIMVFTLAIGIVGQNDIGSSLWSAAKEISGAIILGALYGSLLGILGRKIHGDDLRLPIIIAAIFLTAGMADMFGFSMLLACMVLGLVSKILFKGKTERWSEPSDHIREVIFLIFFVIAGSHFQPQAFIQSFGLILVYIIARSIGKLSGTALGTSVVSTSLEVRRYLGFCLLPQAGVAVGMALKAVENPALQHISATLMNTILGSTILFELSAPIATRWALKKSGELHWGMAKH